jgi:hypothetical protein
MDPAIDDNDVCLTTPLLANLSLNSDADEADVPPVQPVVHAGADDDYDGPFIPRRKTSYVARAARNATDSSSPPPKVCKPGL